MTDQLPFTSREVRWFFAGPLAQNAGVKEWFCNTEPFDKRGTIAPPALERRKDGAPDLYLLLPGHSDMNIKWREGLLQVKGRIASSGARAFSRHEGVVERWLKWSYAGMPEQYRTLFESGQGLRIASVSKMRALRLIDLQTGVVDAVEVSNDTRVDCGIAAEITDLDVEGNKYCTLGFEAFPAPAISWAVFSDAVTAFLDTLGEPALEVSQSMSYPAWLQTLSV